MQRRFFAFASRQRQLVKIILLQVSGSIESVAVGYRIHAASACLNDRRRSIALQDVKDVGIRGEVVHVKRGHMRNYLYPWKHAVYAKGNENLDLLGSRVESSRIELGRACLL